VKLVRTDLPELVVVEPDAHWDDRGSFLRVFDALEWEARGLCPLVAQCAISLNSIRGTLRGLHFQEPPHEEVKLVRCSRGAIFDVAVDLRPASPTFRGWLGIELTEENRRMLYVPAGFAHGFLTLADASEVAYQISAPYVPESSHGVRWDDPAFGIEWPEEPVLLSERDRTFPDFRWSAC
jgi:dTDP-4-dehydrorhamnose 3,5-epimerase